MILAIKEDEIYDEGCEGYGFDAAITHNEKSYELPMNPQSKRTNININEGSIIYRLLPIGEVEREYSVDLDGLAQHVLWPPPKWNFPPTSPSRRTVFVDDDTLCQLKNDSVQAKFTLGFRCSPPRLRAASARQRKRMGERYREHKQEIARLVGGR